MNDVVPSFPAAAFRIEKCEPDRSALIRGDGYVHEVSLQCRSRGIRIVEALPFVIGPMKANSGGRLDTERIAFFNRAALPVVFPNFEATTVPALPQVPLGNRGDHVEDFAVGGGTQELDVFGVGPHQRHGRPRGFS